MTVEDLSLTQNEKSAVRQTFEKDIAETLAQLQNNVAGELLRMFTGYYP